MSKINFYNIPTTLPEYNSKYNGLFVMDSNNEFYVGTPTGWKKLSNDEIPVTSVNGQTGAVTIDDYQIDYSKQYLTFEALESTTFTLTIGSNVSDSLLTSVSYSINNGDTWVTTNNVNNQTVTITTPTITSGNKVLWKGIGTSMSNATFSTASANRAAASSIFSSSGRFNAEGNIMSLLYGDNFSDKTSFSNDSSSNFALLFYTNAKLVSANNMILPATEVKDNGYIRAFQGCSLLTDIPKLLATKLNENSYGAMFAQCTSLTSISLEIPKILSAGCCRVMFGGCTSLITAPKLPAIILANDCYNSMFDNCALTTAPELPATTLAQNCYYQMFINCSSLVTAPELPATTLAQSCYQGMFQSCTSLTTAPELPATDLTNYCYVDMFYGCTSLIKGPKISAITLAPQCFREMFRNCTALKTAPELLVTFISENDDEYYGDDPNSCCNYMFYGCSSLNYIKCLGTNVDCSNHTVQWVYGVAASGTFVKADSMENEWTIGISGIPSGWTVYTESEWKDVKKYELDAAISNITHPVTSVNGQTGAVTVNVPVTSVNGQTGAVTLSIPVNTSDLTNDSNFTTLSEVQTEIVGAAPEQLNTLAELSAALNDDQNFASTVTNLIGQKYTKPASGIPSTDLADGVIPESLSDLTDDVVAGNYLPLTGGTMSGALTLSGAPILNLHAATKEYVDDSVFGGVVNESNSQYVKVDSIDNYNGQMLKVTIGSFSTLDEEMVPGLATVEDVESVISDNEIAISSALNQLNTRLETLEDNSSSGAGVTSVNGATGAVILELEDIAPHDYSQDYLTFTALQDTTFTFTQNALQYSLDDGTTWTTLSADTASPTVTAGNKIIWKQTGLTPDSSNGIGTFSATGNFNVSGNIMSLHYGDNFIGQTDLTGKNNAFRHLFKNNTQLVNAENLILPATILVSSCYNGMFNGCMSLTKAPELPATTLENACYSCMFNYCSSLTIAPKLPATTLVASCYISMFNCCTSLTTAPELPATTLVSSCYNGMFNGCTSLNYIKCLATNISASNCTYNWVNGVAASGTFIKADSMTSWTTGNNGIPTGWNVCTESEYKEVRHYEISNLNVTHTFVTNIISNYFKIWIDDFSDISIQEMYDNYINENSQYKQYHLTQDTIIIDNITYYIWEGYEDNDEYGYDYASQRAYILTTTNDYDELLSQSLSEDLNNDFTSFGGFLNEDSEESYMDEIDNKQYILNVEQNNNDLYIYVDNIKLSGFEDGQTIEDYIDDPETSGCNPYQLTSDTIDIDGETYYMWERTDEDVENNYSNIHYLLTTTNDYETLVNTSLEANQNNLVVKPNNCIYGFMSEDNEIYETDDKNVIVKVE